MFECFRNSLSLGVSYLTRSVAKIQVKLLFACDQKNFAVNDTSSNLKLLGFAFDVSSLTLLPLTLIYTFFLAQVPILCHT